MKRTGITVILTIVIIVLVAAGGVAYARKSGYLGGGVQKFASSDSDYSAVFLTNGQVYFGKIYSSPSDTVDLRDIYYLQVNQAVQGDTSKAATATDANNIQLVKLGQELHGPDDDMQINKQQVIFTESLKSDSKVVKAIADYKAK
jgi:hypothetical protein